MVPKLISALGLIGLVGAMGLIAMAASARSSDHAYALNVTPNGPDFKIEPKPPYFELSFAGNINWDFTNKGGDSVTVKIRDFESGYGGGCPVHFTFGGDGPAQCSATQIVPAGQTRTIIAERGDSDPDNTTRYEFRFTVNERPTDPDIEIERDPYRLIHFIVALVSAMLVGVGWWLGRRN
jgi:hypothetical protein